MEKVKKAFDAKGITIPYPQRDVHVYQHTSEVVGTAALDKIMGASLVTNTAPPMMATPGENP
jgi:small-conductance mechanosensitive channel